jgi:DNA-binding PadR family transcriptional regulator
VKETGLFELIKTEEKTMIWRKRRLGSMFHRKFFEFEGRARLFEKGDLKYVVLDLLNDKPRHGYEIIRALEERFHGFYTPSAGSVYPTLQLLEDMGYVKSVEQDGKKVYTITEEGKKFLSEREETVDKIRGHMREWWGNANREELRDTMREWREVARQFAAKAHNMGPDKMTRIKEIISQACKDIEKVLNESK